MEKWPTPIHLAAASEDVVQSAWAGLGFYRRARNLHLGAKKVVEKYNGVVPSTVTGLLDINGIGEYTAGAIASIAFGIRTPLVDGNVIRVISRLKALGGLSKKCVASGAAIKDAKSPELSKSVWSIVRRQGFINEERPGDFNQALMEFGATLCTPRNPLCFKCPLGGAATSEGNIICKAYLEAKEETKTIAATTTTTTTTTALVEIEDLTKDDDIDHSGTMQQTSSTSSSSTSSSLLSKTMKSSKVENKSSSTQIKNSKALGKALIQTKLSFGSSKDGSRGGSTLLIVSSSDIKGEGGGEEESLSIISSAISTYISDRFPPIHSKTPSPVQKVVAVVFETRFTDNDKREGGEKKASIIDDKKFLVIKREGGAAGGAASGLLAGQWQTFCFCNGAAISSTTTPSISTSISTSVSTLKEKVIKKRKRKNETVVVEDEDDEDKEDDEKDDMKEKMSSTSSVLKSNTSSTLPLTLGDIRALSPHLDKALNLCTSDHVIIRGPKKARHIFSHVVHDITVFTILVSSSVDKSRLANQLGVSDHKWVTASEMQELGLSTWALKIFDTSGSFTDLKGAEWMRLRLKG